MYLEGAAHPIQVFTDHKNVEYFSQTRTTSRRHARWAAILAAYDYTIVYRKGDSNGKPDALSRRPDYIPPPFYSFPILPTPPSLPPLFHTSPLVGAAVLVSPDDPLLPAVAAAQDADVAISAIISTLRGGPDRELNPELPQGNPPGRSLGQYALQGGLLYSQGRLVIPPTAQSLILQILQQYHDSPQARHNGVARTQALVAQYFIWPGLARDVEAYVRNCDTCARNKAVRHAPYGLFSPLPFPHRP